jgi:hypothetical protein
MRALGVSMLAGLSLSLAACGGDVPSGNPADEVGRELRGYRAPPGVMMGADEKPYWVQSAIKGFRPVKDGDVPGSLVQREGIGGCAFTRPAENEVVATVMVDDSLVDSPVYILSRRLVGDRAENLINVLKANGKTVVASDVTGDSLNVVDVAVTERSKPVYLVLASGGGLLFNVHLAPGARVSRVAVIGGRTMAVANLDPATPVEFLTGDAGAACGATPMRIPADHWSFVRNAREAGGSLDDVLERNYAMQRQWAQWFRDSFGVDSEPGASGAATTAHVLAGPMPASSKERATYRPLKGATVLISRADYIVAGSRQDYRKLNSELVRTAATEAAGGDLAALRPTGG